MVDCQGQLLIFLPIFVNFTTISFISLFDFSDIKLYNKSDKSIKGTIWLKILFLTSVT